MKIEVYNEAGEKIKLLVQTGATDQVQKVVLLANGSDTTTFSPQDGPLTISIPGTLTSDQLGGNVSYDWDGQNDSGQAIAPGVYYIKVSFTDSYDHVQTIIQNINVLGLDKHLRVSVYNSAGELVRRLQAGSVPATLTGLEVDDVVSVGKNNPPVNIGYAAGQVMQWDGKNADGKLVDSGMYEIQVELDSGSGYKIASSKSVMVLNDEEKNFVKNMKAYPNPMRFSSEAPKPVTITWDPGVQGNMIIEIYNESSELVSRVSADLASGAASWNAMTPAGSECASGMYLIVFHAKKTSGEIETSWLKFAILKK